MRARLAMVVAALAALGASAALAEPNGRHFEFSQFAGYTLFDENRNGISGTELKDALYLGGRFGYWWNRYLALEGAAGFTPTQEDITGGEDFDFWHASGNVLLRPNLGGAFWPYAILGGGVSRLKPAETGTKDTQGNAEVGIGAQYWLTDVVGLRFEARDIMWLPKESITDIESHTFVVGAGLTFAIGAKPRDTDGDGVPDRRDACANTPAGARVNETGCPTDADGDGVFDGLDACEGTAKGCKVDSRGCPTDADGDGVCDGVDACADTPKGATVDAKGCTSDADGDGVVDGIDQCASTAAGCAVDEKGCPKDADGDGVCDGVDKCPDTSPNLRVDKDGCPIEVSERETELLDTGMIRLDNVEFETAKADLKPEALPQLDIVGQVLTKWPELKVEIGGHTDSRGSNAMNQTLSEARVKSVLDYLLGKFPQLKPEQYSSKGYGESKPLVPNNSPEAMSRNRRVEFVVLNKEVLKREIERRKLLEKP